MDWQKVYAVLEFQVAIISRHAGRNAPLIIRLPEPAFYDRVASEYSLNNLNQKLWK